MKKTKFMPKTLIFFLFLCLFLQIIPNVAEATSELPALTYFDMNNWSKSGPSYAGTWTVQPGGRTVKQSINGVTTFFVSPDNYINQIIKGTISIGGSSDDDFVGFVMGYQEPVNVSENITNKTYSGEHEFVLFDWKRLDQTNDGYPSSISEAGYSLVYANGTFDNTIYTGGFGDYSKYFWYHENITDSLRNVTILATDYGTDKGWTFNKEYQFEILYTETQVKIKIDNVVIFDVSGSFIPGKIGFYNLSQNPVTYGNVKTAPSSQIQVAPVTKEDRYITSTNTLLTVSAANGILTNDYDPNLDNYSIFYSTTTSHGILDLDADGSFVYTPATGYYGPDSFTYNLEDSTNRTSETTTVYINTIVGANAAPTDIIFDTNQIYSNSPNGTVVSTLTTTDINVGDYHDYMLINSSSGRFGIVDNEIIINDISKISPHGNYSITVRSTDLSDAYIEEDFTITVDNLSPEISQGAYEDVRMSKNGSPTDFSLTLNATDEDNDTITWSVNKLADHGSASVSGTGSSKSISYTPDTDFYGYDSFTVSISDGYDGTDEITINVTVNALPVAGFGYALNFDGTNEYVDMGNNIIVGNNFTEEAWIYPTDTGDSEYHGFLGYQPEKTFDRPPSLWSYDKKKIHGGFGDGTDWNSWISNEDVLIFDTWNHIAASFDGNTYKLYVNGNLAGISVSDFTGKTPSLTPIRYIGRVDNYFKGGIDEVRIWNTAVSEADIKSWMNRDITSNHPDYNNLLGYWQFNQTIGTNSDDSKNNNDGTLINMENDDWTVSTIPNRYFVNEGESVNIYLIGYDYNDDDLTFEIADSPSNGSLSGSGSELTYTHNGGETTSDIIRYKVKDYESTSINTAEIEIIVIPVNDNPIITHQSNLSVDEGVSIDLPNIVFTDEELTDTHRAEVYYTEDVATNYPNISSPFDIGSKMFPNNGIYPITVKIFDNNGGSDTMTYDVVVNDTTPTATLTGYSILNEGSTGNFDASGSSGYDVPLTFEWDWDYDGSFTASQDTRSTASHIWNNNDDYIVAVRVKDNDDSTSIDTISVTVNDLSPTADFEFTDTPKEGLSILFTDSSISSPDSIASWNWDLDGDGDTDSTIQNPETIYGNEGTFIVTLVVTDSDGSIDSITHTVSVENVAPIIDNSSKSGIEDNTLTFSKTDFTDNYNDVIIDELNKIKITNLPEHGVLKINETTININDEIINTSLSAITYVPDENWNGSTSFDWQASDGVDYSLIGTLTINISPVNDALVNTTAPSYSGIMHNGKTLTIDNGSWNDDIDGNSTDSISFAYQWQRADDASGTNIIDIGEATESTYNLTINDNDKYIRTKVTGTDSGTPDSESLTIFTEWKEVLNVAPIISDGESITINMSEDGNPTPFTLTLNATDSDDDEIAWSISSQAVNGTAIATGTGTSKVISYTPDSDHNGSDSFVVDINDGNGGVDSVLVNIIIEPVNDAPENTSIPSYSGTMHNGQILTSIPGVWNDIKDNNEIDTITYTYQWQRSIDSLGTDFSDIDNATSSAYTLTLDDNDKYIRIKVTGTDSGNPGIKTTDAFSIGEIVQNNSPVISQGSSENINVDEDDTSFVFTLDANDSDEDIITWSISTLPENGIAGLSTTVSGISQEISYIPDANYYGTDSFEISVSDVNGGSDSISINITVRSINDLPIITPTNTIYVYKNETVHPFEISFSDVESADSHTGRIDWSDGSAIIDLGSITSPFVTTEHSYIKEGSYKAKVIVRDNNGGETTSSILIVVRERYKEPIVDLVFGGEINNRTTLVNTDQENGNVITNIQFRNDNINKLLSNIPDSSNILVPAEDLQSDQINSILNGQLVKNLENKDVSLEIQTMRATYILPLSEINIDEISNQYGENINLEEILISVKIGEASLKDIEKINNYKPNGNMELIIEPISFEIVATYGIREINISGFSRYVERLIPISNDTDNERITTAVVLDEFGNLLHVPTKIVVINGKYYAKISSLTNGTYSLIWNPIEFADVSSHWSKEAVNDMGSRLVVNGYGEGMFEPDQSITRAEFTSIIIKALGLRNASENTEFSDVNESDWFYDSLNIAKEYKLINGYVDGSFKPDNKITRQEAMGIMSKAMELCEMSSILSENEMIQILSKFEDNDEISNWAKKSAATCVESNIFNGSDNELNPKSNITRAETATIVRRLLIEAGLI